MSNYQELISILKELLTNRFYPKPDYIRGLLGNGQGSVIVPDRPDYNYVRFNRSSTEIFEVFNKEVGQPVDGWPVLIGEFPWQPGLVQVVATDWSAYAQTEWGERDANIQAHAPTHAWPDKAPGSDPLDIYLRAIAPMRTYTPGSGSTSVYVSAYEYDRAGTGTYWGGMPPINLNPVDMVTGTMRFMGIYLNPQSNALGAVTGATVALDTVYDPPRPNWPLNIYPSAYVRVYGGQASILDSDIVDARRLWNTTLLVTGTAGGGGIPESIIDAKGDLIAGTAADTAARQPAGSDGQILMADSSQTTGLLWTDKPGQLLSVVNTSGATASADRVGYLVNGAEGLEFKFTVGVADIAVDDPCVVVVGGANNAAIKVATRGRFSLLYTGTAPTKSQFLVYSGTSGSVVAQAFMSPDVIAVAMADGAGGTVDALMLGGRKPRKRTSAESLYELNASAPDSDFRATINGAPSGTSVVYNAPSSGSALCITPSGSTQLAKLRLYNETRANYALVASVNGGTNTITVTDAADISTWQSTDTITARSQTNTNNPTAGVYFFDYEFTSSEIPDLAVEFEADARSLNDTGAANARLFVHPFEANAVAKQCLRSTPAAGVPFRGNLAPMPIISNRFCMAWDASGTTLTFTLQIFRVTVAVP